MLSASRENTVRSNCASWLGRKVVGMMTYSLPPCTSNSAFTAVVTTTSELTKQIGAKQNNSTTLRAPRTFFLLAELALAQEVEALGAGEALHRVGRLVDVEADALGRNRLVLALNDVRSYKKNEEEKERRSAEEVCGEEGSTRYWPRKRVSFSLCLAVMRYWGLLRHMP